MKFSIIFQAWLQAKGFTVGQAAEYLKKDEETLNHWKSGRRNPTVNEQSIQAIQTIFIEHYLQQGNYEI